MSAKAAVITVELKNGVTLQGKLGDMDKNMNFYLYDINVDLEQYPQFVSFHTLTLGLYEECFC